MASDPQLPAGLVVIGCNHRSSSVMLRDQIFIDDAAAPAVLERLRGAGLGEALILSTCDRVEVQGIHDDRALATAAVTEALAQQGDLDQNSLGDQIYSLDGVDALRHVFAVASSLDSQVIGEPQVLGQVKASHRLSKARGACGARLDTVMQAAFATAKRVRRETAIAERPVSIAAAAIQLARDVHGDLARCQALVIGGAEMGELMAEHLVSGGLGRLVATAPSERRADAMARRFGCNLVPFESFAAALSDADIIVSSLGARQHAITAELVEEALKRRRRRPIFLIDAAVPGDIAPAVNRVEDAFLYDLEELEEVALAGRATREAAAAAAHAIVADEVEAFCRARASRRAAPTVSLLRDHFEAIRQEVVREAGNDADRATRLLVNRLLHEPSAMLREIAGEAGGNEHSAAATTVRRLFGLNESAESPGAEADASGETGETGENKESGS